MEAEKPQLTQQEKNSLRSFVFQQMQLGDDKETIINKLAEKKIDREVAAEMVEFEYNTIMEGAKKEEFKQEILPRVIIGGFLAAVVGGIIWGAITAASEQEFGLVAWAMGLLCGLTVILFSKGQRGTPLQIIATSSSVLGILIGKYVTYYYLVVQKLHPELSIFSGRTIAGFKHDFSKILSGYDVLWIALAFITAWGIPRKIWSAKLKIPPSK